MAATTNMITAATPAQLDTLLALLACVGLPGDGVAEYLANFLVATDEAGILIGCIGLERHAKIGLLRSLAVAPAQQGRGLGTRLTSALLALAAQQGIEDVVLLTTTAGEFFMNGFGFQPAARVDYDAALVASPEWQLPCCSSAAFLRLSLAKSAEI
ncbi:MAG: GNAT family N-acetyltransferase [Blastocatellia bacterium]